MARWVGHASSAFAVGQVVVKHRRDEGGARVSITIPDHVDVTGQLQQGGQYRLLLSSVLGHTPSKTEAWIFGDKGTLAFITPNDAPKPYLRLAKKGGKLPWARLCDRSNKSRRLARGGGVRQRHTRPRGGDAHGLRYCYKIYGMD